MVSPQHIVYIHGFNSSPQSFKAQVLARYLAGVPVAERPSLHVPALPYEPAKAIQTLEQCVTSLLPATVGLIGSSLGGYYGLWLAERFRLPLALINPAVYPYRLLLDYLGETTHPYSGETYVFTEREVAQLKAFEVETITRPERYYLLTQTGDEVLDYREAVAKLAQVRQTVQVGGDHNFCDFERVIPDVLAFLSASSAPVQS